MKNSILLLTLLMLVSCASGTAIVTGTTRPAINPQSVELYLQPPRTYDVIGIVKASSDAGWTDQGSQDYAVEELKSQAAKLGANGVLITATGEKSSATIGSYGTNTLFLIPIEAQVVSGQAIYVTNE